MTLRHWRGGAQLAYLALIALTVLWEAWLAPSRASMAFWLTVKLVPLLLPLGGILRDRPKAFAYGCLIALPYFTEGVVLGYTRAGHPPAPSELGSLALAELLLVTWFFFSAAFYLRARRRADLSAGRARAETEW